VPRRLLLFVVLVLAASACEPSDDGGVVRPAGPTAGEGSPVVATPDVAAPIELEPLLGHGDFVAVPRARLLPMWERPGGGPSEDFRLDTRNPHGIRAPLLIERARRVEGDAWYELLLPIRPNGTTAWARGADLEVRRARERIVVDLSRRLLWHYVDGELAERLRVGVGTPATPTATGRFSVWVKVRYDNEDSVFGFLALGLSGFPPDVSEWQGDGRMAIHGTTDPTDRGQAVSAGCIRVFNGELDVLLGVPLGTPVVIRA
jgi:hypothetical protein